jgi:hypothetical protein
MIRPSLFLALLLPGVAFANPPSEEQLLEAKCDSRSASGQCTLYEVSIIELIARPKVFHGKRVRIIGYARIEFEGSAIYLSKESYDAHLTKNALWLGRPQGTPLTEKHAVWGPQYAIVEGEFDAMRRGHMDSFSGSIRNTTRLDPWK